MTTGGIKVTLVCISIALDYFAKEDFGVPWLFGPAPSTSGYRSLDFLATSESEVFGMLLTHQQEIFIRAKLKK